MQESTCLWKAQACVSRYQSGETDRIGRISKAGDGSVRWVLYEAAHLIITKPLKGCTGLKSLRDAAGQAWRDQESLGGVGAQACGDHASDAGGWNAVFDHREGSALLGTVKDAFRAASGGGLRPSPAFAGAGS